MDPGEESILTKALNLESVEARAAYLDKACGDRPELRKRVESLLNAYDEGAFLEQPAQPLHETETEYALDDETGSQVGPYKLLQRIGQGGMGEVYMAEQREPIKRKVAVKLIKLGMDTKQVVARFEAERQALALMDHPNIAKVLDAGATDEGRPYFVMELVRGVPITQFCDEHKLSTFERLKLFIPVCQAIQHAHQKAIIHRDIKPSNVLVTMHDDRPVPKVIDFGIAKATQSELTAKTVFTRFEQFIGTPAYMSPEQAQMSGIDVDTRCDVYALGVLLYELLTGATPFDQKELLQCGYEEICRRLREEEPPKPSTRVSSMDAESRTTMAKFRGADADKLGWLLKGDLDWIIMKAMEKDRTRRYETANGLAQDVQRFLADEPVSAVAPSRLYQLRKFARRNRAALTTAAAFAAVLVAGTIVASWQAYAANRQRERAERAERTAEDRAILAQTNERKAAIEAERATRLHYFASMQLILHGWQSGDLTRVSQLLKDTGDFPWRGFEWRFWQRRMHGEIRTLIGHENRLRDVTFSPDGRLLATCGDDGTARVWNLLTGAQPLVFRHGKFVRTVDFSNDGNKIVTAGGILSGLSQEHVGAVIWDVKTGNKILEISPHNAGNGNYISSACFSLDDSQVVCGENDGVVRVCDANSGEGLFEMEARHAGDSFVWDIEVSIDGKIVTAAYGDSAARVWDANSGRLLHRLAYPTEVGFVTCVSISGDGTKIATGTWESHANKHYEVRLWDATAGEPSDIKLSGHTLPIWGIEFSPDGQRIVTASFDQTTRLWDATSGEQLGPPFKGHTAGLWGVALSPADGRTFATAGRDNVAKLWDADADREPVDVPLASNVKSCRLLSDGSVVAFREGGEWSIDETSVGAVRYIPLSDFGHAWPHYVAGNGDNLRILTVGADQTGRIWDRRWERPREIPYAHSSAISAVAMSEGGEIVVTGYADGSVSVWNAELEEPLHVPARRRGQAEPGWGRVGDIAIEPNGHWFVVVRGQAPTTVYDITTGAMIHELDWRGTSADKVAISAAGDRIATGGWGNLGAIWDLRVGSCCMRCAGIQLISTLSALLPMTNGSSRRPRMVVLACGRPPRAESCWCSSTSRREIRWAALTARGCLPTGRGSSHW